MLFLQECPSPGAPMLLLRRGECPGDAASGRGRGGENVLGRGMGWSVCVVACGIEEGQAIAVCCGISHVSLTGLPNLQTRDVISLSRQ